MVGLIAATSYAGIFVLMALESACIPLPSEVTMPFAGFLVSQGAMSFWLVVLAGALGNLVGSLFAFAAGWRMEERLLRGFIRRHGKWVLMTEHDYDQAEVWFRRHGEIVVFVSRLLPIVRTFISLPAGVARMNVMRFSIYTFVGSLLWSALLTYVGVQLGEHWHDLSGIWHQFDAVIGLAIVAAIAFYIWHKREVLGQFRRGGSIEEREAP
jgi:membrane protein DedA with SNARE-associated domain